MKLLQKATLYYAIIVIVLMIVLTGFFYGIIQFYFLKSLDKSLLKEKEKVSFSLALRNPPPQMIFDADEEVDLQTVPFVENKDDIYHTIYYKEDWDTSFTIDNEPEPHRELVAYIPQNNKLYRLTIRKSMIESEDLLSSILWIEIIVLAILMGSFLVVNVWISKKLWKSFYDTLNKIKTFNLSSEEILKVNKSSISEFEEMNQVLQAMSSRIQKDYRVQKQFIENASHELQTPLMVLRSKIELLVQQPELSEKQIKLIESIDNASLKLAHINRALLLLSKIENNQFSKTEVVELVPLLKRVIDNFSDRIHLKSIRLEMQIYSESSIILDPVLAEILFTNLIQNAIRHNFNGGFIKIEIKSNSVEISNSGEEPDFDSNSIFQRFKKSFRSTEGTGLGLSIVKEICNVGSIKIQYKFLAKEHIFMLSW